MGLGLVDGVAISEGRVNWIRWITVCVGLRQRGIKNISKGFGPSTLAFSAMF